MCSHSQRNDSSIVIRKKSSECVFRNRHFRCISNGRSHRKAKSQYSGNCSRCFHCSFDTELFSRIVLFMETAIYLAERMKQRPNTIAKGNCFVRARQQSLAIDKSACTLTIYIWTMRFLFVCSSVSFLRFMCADIQ